MKLKQKNTVNFYSNRTEPKPRFLLENQPELNRKWN